jgi:hypothetical protein
MGYFSPDTPLLASATIGLVDRKEPAAMVTLYLRRAAVIRGMALDDRGASLGGNVINKNLSQRWETTRRTCDAGDRAQDMANRIRRFRRL